MTKPLAVAVAVLLVALLRSAAALKAPSPVSFGQVLQVTLQPAQVEYYVVQMLPEPIPGHSKPVFLSLVYQAQLPPQPVPPLNIYASVNYTYPNASFSGDYTLHKRSDSDCELWVPPIADSERPNGYSLYFAIQNPSTSKAFTFFLNPETTIGNITNNVTTEFALLQRYQKHWFFVRDIQADLQLTAERCDFAIAADDQAWLSVHPLGAPNVANWSSLPINYTTMAPCHFPTMQSNYRLDMSGGGVVATGVRMQLCPGRVLLTSNTGPLFALVNVFASGTNVVPVAPSAHVPYRFQSWSTAVLPFVAPTFGELVSTHVAEDLLVTVPDPMLRGDDMRIELFTTIGFVEAILRPEQFYPFALFDSACFLWRYGNTSNINITKSATRLPLPAIGHGPVNLSRTTQLKDIYMFWATHKDDVEHWPDVVNALVGVNGTHFAFRAFHLAETVEPKVSFSKSDDGEVAGYVVLAIFLTLSLAVNAYFGYRWYIARREGYSTLT